MKNLFFYQRKQPIPPKEGETELKFEYFKDSFNVNKVIRSVQMENGSVLVLLDDIHQRTIQVPVMSNSGKQTGVKNQTNTYQTEITLELEEDIERFGELLGIKE